MATTSPKQVMHFDGRAGIGAAEANENQRKWSKDDYQRENQKPRVFYDWSRRHLNFEITADRQIRPCGTSESVAVRFQRRMDELGQKPIDMKKDKKKLPNRLVRFVFSGGTERMREMAFGNQKVNFDWDKNAHNENVVRQKEIERWALDIFDWVSDKYGRNNIVGFDVHLDENSPHIHCSVVPVTMRKNRTTNKMEETVSWKAHFGKGFVDGKKIRADLHTDLHEVVNRRYGMVRGEYESGAKHMNKTEYFRLLERKTAETREELRTLEEQLTDIHQQLEEVEMSIRNSSENVQELEVRKRSLESRYSSLLCAVERKRDSLRNNERKVADLERAIAETEKKLEELGKQDKQLTDTMTAKSYNIMCGMLARTMVDDIQSVQQSHPQVESMLQNTVFEGLDDALVLNILADASKAFIQGANIALTPQQSSGGGGGNNDLPRRNKDEDLERFAQRCVKWSVAKNKPRKRGLRR